MFPVEYDQDSDFITGNVVVELEEIIGHDLGHFFDMLSERLTGTDLLMEIDYSIILLEGVTSLLFQVSGKMEGIREVYSEGRENVADLNNQTKEENRNQQVIRA